MREVPVDGRTIEHLANAQQEPEPDDERWDLMHEALEQLPATHRHIVEAHVFGEIPFTKLGDIYGKSRMWASRRFYEAIEMMREITGNA